MSELPSSLTVLRPISFTGAMKGPDGRSSRPVAGGADDALDPEVRMHAASMLNAPTSPASGDREGSPTAASSALSPSGGGLQISQPLASSPKLDRPSDRQRRMNDATRTGAASSSTAATVVSPSALDGEAVDIDLEAGPDDEEVGFSAAELAGGHAAAHGQHHHSHHQQQQQQQRHSHSASAEGDEHKNVHFSEEHLHELEMQTLPQHHQQPRLTVDPPRNASGYPTPPINTRTVLLHADHTDEDSHPHAQQQQHLSLDFESSLPRDSTVPPMARQKVESFDELRRKARHKVKLLELLAAATFVMGVTCVGVGAASLETAMLYPTLPAATIAAGLLLVLFAPLSGLAARRFKDRELRALYFSAGALLAFLLILGIVSASKTEDSIRSEVLQRWDLSASSSVDGYSESFKAKWGDEQNLIDTAWRHLTDLVIVQFIAAAVLLLLGLLTVRLSHSLQRHLALVALATESKSESNSKAHKRAREVAAYKAKLAAGDRDADRDLQQERIPEEVKAAQHAQAQAKKYAASAANTPGTKSRKLGGATPKADGRALASPKEGGKTPKASAKTPKAGGGAGAADAAEQKEKDPDRVEKLKTPKTPKRSVGAEGAGGAGGTTLAEKKERKKRKKEKRDKESAALRAQRKAGASGGGDGAATSRDVMPVVEMESSDSEREDEKV